MTERKMMILVNLTLGMSPGKVAAQVGHVCQHISIEMFQSYSRMYFQYLRVGSPKIILQSNEKEMLQLLNEYRNGNIAKENPRCLEFRDLGKNQCPVNSLTVLGFYPTLKLPERIKSFRLY